MKDIIGMISGDKFTVQQIKCKIISMRSLHPENNARVKMYFLQGNDSVDWLEF